MKKKIYIYDIILVITIISEQDGIHYTIEIEKKNTQIAVWKETLGLGETRKIL